tara:strand:- start:443 stop:670 length:228 start_codon:yes stop_codon:yes gene_type:complete
MTKKTVDHAKRVDELEGENQKLLAELARMNDEKRQLLGALDAQNIRLNTLERSIAVASGAVEVPPLTVSFSQRTG